MASAPEGGAVQVNIFSGGRRMALVFGAAAAALAGSFAWIVNEPRFSLSYRMVEGTPVLIDGYCDYSTEAVGTARLASDAEADIAVTLCLPIAFSDMADKAAAVFQIPVPDKQRADLALSEQVNARFKLTAGSVLAVAVAVWLMTAILGWIVRGFLGVPRGQDFRPQ